MTLRRRTTTRPQNRPLTYLALLAALVLGAGRAAVGQSGRPFPVPEVGREAVWEAEDAEGATAWNAVNSARASGRRLVVSRQEGAALRFSVDVPQAANLRLWPVLGPHGDRRPPRRFPYPLERRPGPDTIDWAASAGRTLLYFTAPAEGRVAAVDCATQAIVKSAAIGGYLADLLVDRQAGRLYVADATGSRVVCLDPSDLSVTREIRVPEGPWSLALHEGVLYAGCLQGKRVVAIDTEAGTVAAERALPYEVIHLEVDAAGGEPRLAAWPRPAMIDLERREMVVGMAEQWAAGRRTAAETGPRNQPGFRRFTAEGTHRLKVETITRQGREEAVLDTTPVTGGPALALAPAFAGGQGAGPAAMVMAGGRLFFTAPAAGRLGIVDASRAIVDLSGKAPALQAVEVGGYLADLVADASGERVFVADAAGNRVVAIDAKTGKVVGECPVPGMPCALESFAPPAWLKGCQPSILVSSWETKEVAAIDPATLKLTPLSGVPAEPDGLAMTYPPSSGWWPLLPLDRIAPSMRAYLGVRPAPHALRLRSLEDLGPARVSPGYQRRTVVTVDLAGGKRQITADNAHILQFAVPDAPANAAPQLIDTSDVTDGQRITQPQPLGLQDVPGALTVSVDGGPSFSWRRGVWMTPDQGQLVQAGTPEFQEWNALTFSLEPGRHTFTLAAHSPWVQVDAVRASRTLRGWAELSISGRPPDADKTPVRYRSLFYDQEPVQVDVRVANALPQAGPIRLDYVLRNYMGEPVDRGKRDVPADAGAGQDVLLSFQPRDTGTFALSVTASSPAGQMAREYRFVRLPKLEHPRLLFRRRDMPAIQARVEKHRVLFDQYFAWLRRQCDREGFLPAGILKGTFGPAMPAAQKKLANKGEWRRYELGWRVLAVQLGAMFAPDAAVRDYFRGRIARILADGKADWYCTFHYHGPFFPGFEAVLYDLVAATPGQADDLVARWRASFEERLGNMDVFPWTLAAIEEPLDARERAILCHVGEWLHNVERYFDAHMGARGGNRWLSERTGCFCPYAGYGYSFIYLSHLLDEPRFHEKPIVAGFRTHTLLAHPRNDARNMLGPAGPRGEPLRWLDAILSRHPLAKSTYHWDPLVKRLDQDTLPAEEIDRMLDYKECASTSEPMAFVAPLGMALGWYDPAAPEVRYEDLPPTVLFDVEGQAAMRSGWGKDATEVLFTCGVRDHVYRHQPTDLSIARAGEFLLGTASSWGDDGNIDPGKTWGNVVVIEPSDWIRRWGENKMHPRAEEYAVFNRFSDDTFRYLARDRRLTGYAPAENGFGGGVDLHGHTESVFLQDGELLAYETRPQFDYVAGDATNSWPLGTVDEATRQVVYLKPDTLVVYDRVALGEKAERSYWVAATGPELRAAGQRFLVRSGDQALCGDVLLPARARMETYDPSQPGKYSTPPPFSVGLDWHLFDNNTKHQKVLEIHPAASAPQTPRTRGAFGAEANEYLVVLQAAPQPGQGEPAWARPVLTAAEGYAGASFRLGDRDINVRFRRQGDVGGDVSITQRGRRVRTALAERVEDTYRHWRADPRYRRWVSDPKYAFVIPERDRRR